jgi:ferrous iron transport protein B
MILALSIILWAMMSFPTLPQKAVQEFENQRQTILPATPASVVQEWETTAGDSELSTGAQSLNNQLQNLAYKEAEAGLRHSIAGRLGTALEGLSRWAGFDWRTNIALIGGFAAKEVVVSTLGTAYSLGEVDPEASRSLSETLAEDPNWSPLIAIGLIVFTMFYSPCFVSVICISRESGTWKWGAFAMLFNTALAFVLAVLIFQVGSALGILVN